MHSLGYERHELGSRFNKFREGRDRRIFYNPSIQERLYFFWNNRIMSGVAVVNSFGNITHDMVASLAKRINAHEWSIHDHDTDIFELFRQSDNWFFAYFKLVLMFWIL